MKNIILTDLHIKEIEDSFFRVKKEKMIQDCIHEIINNKELKRVFFNGDIFNESKVKTSGYAVNFFVHSIVEPLLNAGKELHFLVGNHERNGHHHTYSFLDGVISNNLIHIHADIEHFEFDDFVGLFIPFMYPGDRDVKTVAKLQDIVEKEIKEKISLLKKDYPNKKLILFNHNMMSDLPFDIGREINLKIWEYMGVDFVFGGHIHKQEDFFVKGEKKGMYVGSFMRSFTYEEETEGYCYFDVNDGKIVDNYIKNNGFDFKKIVIHPEKEDFDMNNIPVNTIYDIEFKFNTTNTADTIYITNVLRAIKDNGSYVKNYYISYKESNEFLNGTITLMTSESDILNDFLKESKIDKDKYDSYFEKLKKCDDLDTVDFSKQSENELKNLKAQNSLNSIINHKLTL